MSNFKTVFRLECLNVLLISILLCLVIGNLIIAKTDLIDVGVDTIFYLALSMCIVNTILLLLSFIKAIYHCKTNRRYEQLLVPTEMEGYRGENGVMETDIGDIQLN